MITITIIMIIIIIIIMMMIIVITMIKVMIIIISTKTNTIRNIICLKIIAFTCRIHFYFLLVRDVNDDIESLLLLLLTI